MRTGDLPPPTHSFVGRDRELAAVEAVLADGSIRLISLVGPGGIGKTRLAAEALRRFRSATDAAVFWVRLAGLNAESDYGVVERETASAVVAADFSQRSAWEALVETVSRGRTVVVIDNCEHVLDSVRHLVCNLLEAVSGLTVVATSRGPIGWIDECPITVPPLTDEQALTLFARRAKLIGHSLADEDDEVAAADICRHVHNNPLYIQLSTGRLWRQPLVAIRDELTGRADDRRLSWSSGPRAGVDPRHRAVTEVIDWSYRLCSPAEQLLFARMSVMATGHDTHPDDGADDRVGADLDAIRAVCGDQTPDTDTVTVMGEDIEALLEHLVDHCLVTVHLTTTIARYSLLESLRVFAFTRLREHGGEEPGRLAARHLEYYRDSVVSAAARWFGPEERALLDWALAAWDNIRAAIDTSLTTAGDADAGLQICLGLIALRVPFVQGSIRDIRTWTQACLDATETPYPTERQIAARAAICWLAVRQGRSQEADQLLDQCVAICLPADERIGWHERDPDLALPAGIDLAWGTQLFLANRDPRAITVLARAAAKFEQAGDGGSQMLAGMFAGLAAGLLGTAAQARALARGCLDHARAAGAPWAISWAELSWAVALIKDDDPSEAALVLRRALAQQLAVRDRWGAAWAVELRIWALAATIVDETDQARAAVLAGEIALLTGGIATVRAELGIDIASMGTFADESRHAVEIARYVLGPAAYSRWHARGTRLSAAGNEVHRVALGTLTMDPSPWDGLTEIEQQVAILVAAGHTNVQIGRLRGRSPHTINVQLQSVFAKLNISKREEIVLHVTDETIKAQIAQLASELETQRTTTAPTIPPTAHPTPGATVRGGECDAV